MECLDGRLQGDREQQRREWGDMAAIRWLFRLIGWRAYSVILIGVLQCVRAGMDIGLALLMKNAIDGATNGNMQVLLKMATWIAAVLALDLLLYFSVVFFGRKPGCQLKNCCEGIYMERFLGSNLIKCPGIIQES